MDNSSAVDWQAAEQATNNTSAYNSDHHQPSCSSTMRSAGVSVSVPSLLLYAFLSLMMACTVVGNLLVVLSIACFKQLRSQTNVFILSLAVADCLVGVLVMPYSMVRTVEGCWLFGALFCRLHTSLDVMLCSASIFHLGCIAFDRYHAVCNPLLYPAKMSPRRVALLVALCWAVPGAISSYSAVGLVADSSPDVCVLLTDPVYAVTASLAAFYLPMVVMLVAYWKIYRVAKRQATQISAMESQMASSCTKDPGGGKKHRNNAMRREGKAAKTLGVVMGVFLLFWLPFFTVNIVDPFVKRGTPPVVWEVITWISYSNSSLNPFIYGFFNRSFRRAFLMILGCRICLPGFSPGISLSERVQ